MSERKQLQLQNEFDSDMQPDALCVEVWRDARRGIVIRLSGPGWETEFNVCNGNLPLGAWLNGVAKEKND